MSNRIPYSKFNDLHNGQLLCIGIKMAASNSDWKLCMPSPAEHSLSTSRWH